MPPSEPADGSTRPAFAEVLASHEANGGTAPQGAEARGRSRSDPRRKDEEQKQVRQHGQGSAPVWTDAIANLVSTMQDQQRQMMQQQSQQQQQMMSLMATLAGMQQQAMAQPPGPAPAAPPPQVQPPPGLPAALPTGRAQRIPEKITKELEKKADKFEKLVMKMTKTRLAAEKARRDLEVFKNKDNRTYPAGMRAFKTAAAQSELDEPLSACTEGDTTITVILKQGITRREAMKVMHHECSNFLKLCMSEGLDEMLRELKDVTTKQKFQEALQETITECTSDKASELGLDKVDFAAISPEAINGRCEKLWAKIVDHEVARDKHRKTHEEKEARRRKELDEKAAQTKPEEMFDKMLAMKMKAQLEELGAIPVQVEDVDLDSSAEPPKPPKFSETVDAVAKERAKAKNGKSPGATLGANAKPKAAPKPPVNGTKDPKGKSKGTPKGTEGGKTGQDKGKGKDHGKGKGKSKGKDKRKVHTGKWEPKGKGGTKGGHRGGKGDGKGF